MTPSEIRLEIQRLLRELLIIQEDIKDSRKKLDKIQSKSLELYKKLDNYLDEN